MSFDRRFEPPTFDEDIDLTRCETCQHKDYGFTCGDIGYCITSCGESYVIGDILRHKGYGQVNTDWAYDENKRIIPAIEVYKKVSRKLIEGIEKLGHTCSTYHHPMQKPYLIDIIIDGGVEPITICNDLIKLDVIT